MAIDRSEEKTLLDQAGQHLAERQYATAERLYAQAGQEQPENTDAWFGLAVACIRQRRYREGMQAVVQGLMLDRTQVRFHLLAVQALNGMGQYSDAIKAADAALELAPDNTQTLYGKATALMKQCRFIEAANLAERIVHLDPNHANAYLNWGTALHALGRSSDALAVLDRLLAMKPDYANALMNRSSVLFALGRAEESLQSADAALKIQPDSTIALLNRTAALLNLRRPREALATADCLLQLQPRHIKCLINKTVALLALRDYSTALATVFTALTFDSLNPDALELKLQALLGLKRFTDVVAEGQRVGSKYPDRAAPKLALARALVNLGQPAKAEPYVDAVLASLANQPEAVSLKAEILLDRNEWDASQTLLDRALAENSGHPRLWLAKSAILLARESYGEALAAAERALSLEPGQPQAAIHRIAALNGLHRFAEALDDIQKLLESGMIDWQLYANQGGALAGLERLEEAQRAFTQADHLDHEAFQAFRWRHEVYGVPSDALMPDLDPRAEFLALRLSRLEGADWNGYDEAIERTEVLIEQCLGEGCLTPLPTFKALSLPLSLELTAAISRSRGEFLASGMASARHSLAFSAPASSVERLKVGYVSADFRNHPTAHLISGLFRVHNRDRFEIHIYALCKDDGSAYYSQIKLNADRFTDLTGMSNTEAATRIHADGIHILIDLMGYTAYARTEIFALQPAPVQVSYLGYPGTMGAPFIPYIIADPVTLPETLQPFFTEQPVYLPESYQVNDQEQTIATTGIVRKDQGLPETGMVFCCFNKPSKFDPVMFSVWMRILSQVPGSVLWLLAASKPDVASNLRREAESRGIAGERLIFAERLPKDRHLERHRLADLFLDTRIYNAHTTASDALWAGLPVLTGIGQTFQARVAASLLQAVEMPELITHSLEEYESLAVRLATHPAELAGLREKLAHNRLRTPLFDTERFARHLEQAYAMMWDRYSRNLPPAPLHVPPLPRV